MKANKRRVKIERVNDSWLVRYVDRVWHGRYLAAQFYVPDNTRAKVEEWVRSNPKLELV